MRPPFIKLIALALLTAVTTTPAQPSAPKSVPTDDAMAAAPQALRLRKLHLVRPDLIPYPIFFEVYA